MKMKNLFKAFIPAASAASVCSLSAITAFAEGDTASTGSAAGSGSMMIVSMIVLLVLMYFILVRPQKKKEKEAKAMQEAIQIGDEIVTIGGIVGLVVRKGDDNVVIETGGEKNKMRIKLWAISENTSALERAKAAQDKKNQDTGLATGKLKEDKKSRKEKKAEKNIEE